MDFFKKGKMPKKKVRKLRNQHMLNIKINKKTAKKKFKNCETNICLIDFKMCEIAKSIHASIDKYLNT